MKEESENTSVEILAKALRKNLLRAVGKSADAEDAVQEMLLRFSDPASGLSRFAMRRARDILRGRLPGHLFMEVRRAWYRARKTASRAKQQSGLHDSIEDVEARSSEVGLTLEIEDEVKHVLDLATARQRAIVEDLLAGKNSKEIAARIGISIGTVDNELHRLAARGRCAIARD
jgi:RNA polymerase sigma factor (sigma-70 family)